MTEGDIIEPAAVRRKPPGLRSIAGRVGRGLVRLALPPRCLSCGMPVATDGSICSACWASMSLIERPFCDRLAIPFAYEMGEGALCAEAIADPPPFGRMRAVALLDDIARGLVHSLKYHDHLDLVRWMGAWMARAGSDILAEADLVVPVPLHRRRLWQRRFNQSASLAVSIGRAAERPVAVSALRRIKAARQQVGLGRPERLVNVRGAFRVPEAEGIAVNGRRIILVDDVYTTGATVKAATRALLAAGAAEVDVLVFARLARGAD